MFLIFIFFPTFWFLFDFWLVLVRNFLDFFFWLLVNRSGLVNLVIIFQVSVLKIFNFKKKIDFLKSNK